MTFILGIESSCDDTGVAVLKGFGLNNDAQILSNIIITQKNEHEMFGGVVPEIAARSHMKNLKQAMKLALAESKIQITDIDAVAATCGPGLIGGVIVGVMFAKALSSVLGKPFIAVNHLEGHALTSRLTNKVLYPYLFLLASGGHCQYVAVLGLGKYKILGSTMDDALGEAFDKVAKMMNLGFPGGPEIEVKALTGDDSRFNFPLPMINSKNCDMSFSGLKTAVKLKINELGILSDQDICDISASFQKAVTNIIYKKTKFAIRKYEDIIFQMNGVYDCEKTIVVAGGVGANKNIRSSLNKIAIENGYNFVAPPINLCTDNAAMIAFAGLERFGSGIINDVSFRPRARWGLEEL